LDGRSRESSFNGAPPGRIERTRLAAGLAPLGQRRPSEAPDDRLITSLSAMGSLIKKRRKRMRKKKHKKLLKKTRWQRRQQGK
jgi:hypothetical protein